MNGQFCSNLHVCYEYFYGNACRRSINCPHGHQLTTKSHGHLLKTLTNLDLDALTKAFRVYCQSKVKNQQIGETSIISIGQF